MRIHLSKLCTFVLALVLVSCDSGSDSDSDSDDSTTATTTTDGSGSTGGTSDSGDTPTVGSNDFQTSDLVGTWTTSCLGSGTDFEVNSHTYSGTNSITGTLIGYSDASCTTKTFTQIATATYVLGDTLTDPASAKNIDLSLTVLSQTPHTAAIVAEFNTNGECGRTDWQIDQAIDCLEPGTLLFSIIALSDDKNSLFSGDDSGTLDGFSEANRPTSLIIADEAFTKQ